MSYIKICRNIYSFFIQQILFDSYFMSGIILYARNTAANRRFHGAYILIEGKSVLNYFKNQ